MRTTVTLDSDVEAMVKKRMNTTQTSFKTVVNEALRSALSAPAVSEYRVPTFDLGVPSIDITKALAIAGELEDAELLRKLELGK